MLGDHAFLDKLFPILKEKSALKEAPAVNPAAQHHVHASHHVILLPNSMRMSYVLFITY
jgi:hypothetical protein